MSKLYQMESEDGTGSRHALVVLKEMWIVTHLFHLMHTGR